MRPRAGLLLALWCSTGWLLLRAGSGILRVPLGSADALAAWLEQTDPAIVAAAGLRLVAIALCGYLIAVTALLDLASLVRWDPAEVGARRLAPSVLRRMVLGTAGLGLTSTIVSPAVATAAPADRDEDRTAVMVKLEPEPSTSTTSTSPSTTTTTATPTTHPPSPADASATGTAGEDAAESGTKADTWVVQPGDSFWSIAEEIVAEKLASRTTPSPTDAEIGRYWRTLIEANRDRLADRANPDLLLPGQELQLPDAFAETNRLT